MSTERSIDVMISFTTNEFEGNDLAFLLKTLTNMRFDFELSYASQSVESDTCGEEEAIENQTVGSGIGSDSYFWPDGSIRVMCPHHGDASETHWCRPPYENAYASNVLGLELGPTNG